MLIAKHHLTNREVVVVYNAPEKITDPADREKAQSKNLIYIGSFMPYKNVETLIRGSGLLPGFTLHLLSRISETQRSSYEILARQVGANLVFHNGVTDEEYKDLLVNGFALVSASKDEGFGIPLVEAMQLGTPVVVSELEIFNEVAGSAGSFFDPDSPESFSKAVMSLDNQKAWSDKSKLSLNQAKEFDWSKSADALLEQFDRL
jgi:glycosyltransferase involved in cell wall biosynthesis